MRNKVSLLIFVSCLLSITGCTDTNKVYIAKNPAIPTLQPDYENDTLADYVIEVDVEQILNLITSRESFALYIGNASCSSCEAFRPALIEYIYKSKSLIYHFDNLLLGTTYDELPTAYPDYFDDTYPPTPSLYFFKDGALSNRRNGSTRMFEYITFEPIMSGYVNVSNILYILDEILLNQITLLDQATLYFYSRSDLPSVHLYADFLFPYIKTEDSSFYIVDVDRLSLSSEEQSTFIATYGLNQITGEIARYSAGSLSSSIHLDGSNEQAILDWVKAN